MVHRTTTGARLVLWNPADGNPAEKLGISRGRSSKDGYHIYRVPPTILNITLLGGAAAWPFAAHARQPNHVAPCCLQNFGQAAVVSWIVPMSGSRRGDTLPLLVPC